MNVTMSHTNGSETRVLDVAPSSRVSANPVPEQCALEDRSARRPRPLKSSGRWLARRGRRLGYSVAGSLVVVLAAWSAWNWWSTARVTVRTDNAFVTASIHTISTRVAGTVAEVLVEENQFVRAGTLLARLDSRDFEVRREQALAQVARARAAIMEAEAQVARARAQCSSEEARARKAKLDLNRAQTLFQDANGTISRQEFDQAQADSEAAEASVRAAGALIGAAEAQLASAQATEKAAVATLREAELQVAYAEIVAPATGRIGRRNIEVGNRVQPGQSLLALVQAEPWVTANFKETQLTRLRPGQSATVQVDAFPGRVFTAKVASVAPASGAQFALLPPDNATGNFTKIVQRVPVKIVFDAASLEGYSERIVPGMSALVKVTLREPEA